MYDPNLLKLGMAIPLFNRGSCTPIGFLAFEHHRAILFKTSLSIALVSKLINVVFSS